MVGAVAAALGNNLHKIVLDFARGLAGSDAEAVGHAENVRVYGYAVAAETYVVHYVRGLSAHAREREQTVESIGHFAAAFHYRFGCGDNVLRLIAVKAATEYRFFEVGLIHFGEFFGRRSDLKEFFRNYVHSSVGALRAEYDRDEQFENAPEVKFALCVRERFVEYRKDFVGFGHLSFHFLFVTP